MNEVEENIGLHGSAFSIYCQFLTDFAAVEQYSSQNLKNLEKKLQKDILNNPRNLENREYTIYGNFSTIISTIANHREKLAQDIKETIKELKTSYLGNNYEIPNKKTTTDEKFNTKPFIDEWKNTDEFYKNYFKTMESPVKESKPQQDGLQTPPLEENDMLSIQKQRVQLISDQFLRNEKEKNVAVNDSVMKLIIHNISFLKNVEYDLQPIIPKEGAEDCQVQDNDEAEEYDDAPLKRILEKLLDEPKKQDYNQNNDRFNLKNIKGMFDINSESKTSDMDPSQHRPSYRPEEHNLKEKTLMLYVDTMNDNKIRENFARLCKDGNYNIRFDEAKVLISKVHKMLHTIKKDDIIDFSGEAERDLDYIVSSFKLWYNRLLIGIYFELFSQIKTSNYLVSEEIFSNFIVINKNY